MKAKRVTAKILAALLLLESCGVPAFAELSLTEVSLGYSSAASESAETAWENDISPKGFHFELPESFGEQADLTETETNALKDETDASEDDFLQNIVIEWENENSGTDISSEEVLSDELQTAQNDFDTNETQSGTQVQPTTIPGASLKLETNGNVSLRFRASIAGAGRVIVSEYGFLIARTSVLDSLNHALDFELPSSKYIKGIAYSAESGIDHTYRIDEDGNFVFIATCTNIPLKNHVDYLTARPYAIYKTDDVETVLYGESYSDSIYRTAKRGIQIEYSDIFQTVIDNAERNTALFLNANEIAVGETVQRTTQSNPDIDLLKFTPTSSRYYTFTLTSEKNLFYEIADAAGSLLSPVTKDETDHFYLEKSNVYYIRIRGERDSAYTACMTGSLDESVIWDFENDAEGFYFGQDASNGGVSNGILTVAINKTAASADFSNKAYMSKGGLNLDLLKYSKIIVRLKNATSADQMQWYFNIDRDYDGAGNASWHQPIASLPANMSDYQNIEFDLTYRQGALKNLMLGFGAGGEELVGNIYIDSISFIPMPEVLNWNFDNWTANERIGSAVVTDDGYTLNLLGQENMLDPAVYSPEANIGISTELYNKVQVGIRNYSDATQMDWYFSTSADVGTEFNTLRRSIVSITPNEPNLKVYTFDLVAEENWKEIFHRMMLAFHGTGEVKIAFIRFAKFEGEYPDIIWNFDDNTTQGFTASDNGTGVFQHQISAINGALAITRVSEGNGGVFTPLNLKLPTEKYKYLVIGVNSASADSELKVYFDTTATYYAENDTVNAVINTKSIQIKKSDTYREYVVDLSEVEDGWSTNYVGVLNQLMFSLKSNGTFIFDFIKLSNDNTIMIPSENTITFNTSEGKIHPIVVFSNQTPISANTVYIINYDRNALEIDDLCAFTFAKETTRGMIAGTSLEVISVSPGEIQFKINSPENKIITGVLDCIIFKGLMVTSTTVSINRE